MKTRVAGNQRVRRVKGGTKEILPGGSRFVCQGRRRGQHVQPGSAGEEARRARGGPRATEGAHCQVPGRSRLPLSCNTLAPWHRATGATRGLEIAAPFPWRPGSDSRPRRPPQALPAQPRPAPPRPLRRSAGQRPGRLPPTWARPPGNLGNSGRGARWEGTGEGGEGLRRHKAWNWRGVRVSSSAIDLSVSH